MKNTIIDALIELQKGDAKKAEKILYDKLFKIENPSKEQRMDMWSFVGKDKTRPRLSGVFCSDGVKVASDGRVLILKNEEYKEEFEGKVIDKGGNIISEKYFDYKSVLLEEKFWKPIDEDTMAKLSGNLRKLLNTAKKMKVEDLLNGRGKYGILEISPLIRLPHRQLDIFVNTLLQFSNCKIYTFIKSTETEDMEVYFDHRVVIKSDEAIVLMQSRLPEENDPLTTYFNPKNQ